MDFFYGLFFHKFSKSIQNIYDSRQKTRDQKRPKNELFFQQNLVGKKMCWCFEHGRCVFENVDLAAAPPGGTL